MPIDTKRQWCSECEHFNGLVTAEGGTLHCPRDTRQTSTETCTNYTAATAEEEETDMSDRIEESTFTQDLACVLTQDEMMMRSRRAAQIVKEIEDEQAAAKSAASRFKAKIEQLSGEARVIAIEIREEKTRKPVDCKTVRDFGAKTVSEVRLDTGEVLEIRAMTFAELQRELDLTPKAPKPKDATCTEPTDPELENERGGSDVVELVAISSDGRKRKPRSEKPKRNGKTKPGVTHPDDVIGDGGEAL